jgi:segregation and condensation protein A
MSENQDEKPDQETAIGAAPEAPDTAPVDSEGEALLVVNSTAGESLPVENDGKAQLVVNSTAGESLPVENDGKAQLVVNSTAGESLPVENDGKAQLVVNSTAGESLPVENDGKAQLVVNSTAGESLPVENDGKAQLVVNSTAGESLPVENDGKAQLVVNSTAGESLPVENDGKARLALDTTAPERAPVEGEGYKIRLRNFEGPLDLLLFLIRKKQVEINDIPIADITREYLAYLTAQERIDIDREAEFLLMAAVLIYIKSQTLLPREQVTVPDDVTRIRPTDHLMPYDRIKAVVGVLRDKEEEQSAIWQRSSLTAPLPDQDLDLVEVSLFDLAESFFALMKRKQAETTRVFKGKEINMADKTAEIIEALTTRGPLDFLDYLWAQETLEEALIAFFCLLELIKARVVMAVQEQLFNTIKVWLRKDAPAKDES